MLSWASIYLSGRVRKFYAKYWYFVTKLYVSLPEASFEASPQADRPNSPLAPIDRNSSGTSWASIYLSGSLPKFYAKYWYFVTKLYVSLPEASFEASPQADPIALMHPEPRSTATVAVLPGPLFIYLGESASFMQNTRILLQNFT